MRLLIILFSLIVIAACQNVTDKSLVNSEHLDKLYKEITLGQDSAAFVYIYAEYPTYTPFEAVGEGIACIDDVARAAVFYFKYFKQTQNNLYLAKAKKLVAFTLHMQADNGLYYNFINEDYSINNTRINSLAIADWWTWRALWALSEAMIYAKDNEPQYYDQLNNAFVKTIDGLVAIGEMKEIIESLAADQASVFLIALTDYSKTTSDTIYYNYIFQLAQNILSAQKGNAETFPYYAFMSWKNEWHGWGNTQAYALLKAADLTGDLEMGKAAANEIKYFYSYILAKNHLKHFVLNENEQDSHFESFEQIAYAIRPMVWASLELYNQTGDEKMAEQAGKLAAWLAGENVTHSPVYDPLSGICYDGINSADKINLNSGAESTIEALLTIIEVEQNPIANDYLQSSFKKFAK